MSRDTPYCSAISASPGSFDPWGSSPDAIIETVGTLRRITHRLSSAASVFNLVEIPPLTPAFDAARARFNATLTEHFRDCLDFVKRRASGVDRSIPSWDEAGARDILDTLEREVAADNFAALSTLPIQSRRTLLSETENSRRLTVLAGELSEQLSRIAPGERASVAAYGNRGS